MAVVKISFQRFFSLSPSLPSPLSMQHGRDLEYPDGWAAAIRALLLLLLLLLLFLLLLLLLRKKRGL